MAENGNEANAVDTVDADAMENEKSEMNGKGIKGIRSEEVKK